MAWWNDLGEAAGAVVEKAARVAETAGTAIGDVIADVLETAGNAAQDGANAIGARVPGAGGFLAGAGAWFGGIIADAANLAGAIVKAAFGIIAGGSGGLIRITGGIFCLNLSLIRKGLIDLVSSIGGALIIILGKLAALVQRIIFCQNNERPLTKAEKEILGRVFHLSLSLYNIRIIEGWSGIFGITTNGAFTLGNTIYANTRDFAASPEILIHECVHVWQYQVLGPRYTMDALGAQLIYGRNGSDNDAYAWRAELDRGKTRWQDFNKEAAAKHIEDIWQAGSIAPLPLDMTPEKGAFYLAGGDVSMEGEFDWEGTNFSDLAKASVKALREGANIRISKYLVV